MFEMHCVRIDMKSSAVIFNLVDKLKINLGNFDETDCFLMASSLLGINPSAVFNTAKCHFMVPLKLKTVACAFKCCGI